MPPYFDIDGEPIPPENVYPFPPSGQLFDCTRLATIGRSVYYKDRQVVQDCFGVVKLLTMTYREPADTTDDDDDSPPESPFNSLSQCSAEVGSNTSGLSVSTGITDVHRKQVGETTVRNYQPKLRDIGLDNVQTQSICKHPTHIESGTSDPKKQHFANVAALQRKLEHVPETLNKRAYGGFDAQELLIGGALNCSPCRPSDLKYDPVLSVFQSERFHDVPEDILDVLKPGLALAEKILTKGCPRFWIDVCCGQRIVDMEKSKESCSRIERLHPVTRVTHEMMTATISKLQKMGNSLTYRFSSLPNAYGCTQTTTVMPCTRPDSGFLARGQLWPMDEWLKTHYGTANPYEANTVITFNHNFYSAAKLFASQKYPDVAAQLRFTFFFCVNLLHELAHAFESKCGGGQYWEDICEDRKQAADKGDPAPFYMSRWAEAMYKDYDFVEMGAAFEYSSELPLPHMNMIANRSTAFGGRIHPINCDYSCKYGINFYQGDGVGRISKAGMHEIQQFRPYARAVPMGYIEEIQMQAFWDNGPKPSGITVPEYGPQAFTLNTTSTVSWRKFVNESANTIDQLQTDFDEVNCGDRGRAPKRPRLSETNQPSQQHKLQVQSRRLLQTQLLCRPDKTERSSGDIRDEAGLAIKSETELAQVNSERQYFPPSPHQPAIDDYFYYAGESLDDMESQSDSSSDAYDPLRKPASRLTVGDKWLLLEEYASLVYGWDSSYFLARRTANDLTPMPADLIPSTSPETWNQVACDALLRKRELKPERTLAFKRERKAEEQQKRIEEWRILGEMEELIVCTGQSRILFMRSVVNDLPVIVDGRLMTKENFDENFRMLLLKLRDEEKTERLQQLRVSATLGTRISQQSGRFSSIPSADSDLQKHGDRQSNKIIGYLVDLEGFATIKRKSESSQAKCGQVVSNNAVPEQKPAPRSNRFDQSQTATPSSESSHPVAQETRLANVIKQALDACQEAEGKYLRELTSYRGKDAVNTRSQQAIPIRRKRSAQTMAAGSGELWEVEGRGKGRFGKRV